MYHQKHFIMKRLLLISNSTNAGEAYLDYPKNEIKKFLGDKPVKALFIPYAGVTVSFDDYAEKVKARFNEIGHDIESIHKYDNHAEAVSNAEAIVVGGGNTFQLISLIHKNKLIEPVRDKIINGTPYIGWSAGSNVACPTIRTTNDMPITEPPSFNAFNLVPFQINPHYLDANPDGHAGETREMRIEEFMEVNRNIYVAGLREGTMLEINGNTMKLIGPRPLRLFRYGRQPEEMDSKANLDFLL